MLRTGVVTLVAPGRGGREFVRAADWNSAGARKDSVGSSDGALRTADDFWMEPVSSSFAGSCFPPLLIFRSANMLNTRITAATMLSRVLRQGVSQGTAKRFRIGRAPNPKRRVSPLAPNGKGNLTALRLINS